MNYKVSIVTGADFTDPLARETLIYIMRTSELRRDVLAHSDKGWYWKPVVEGMMPGPEVGFRFPSEANEAFVEAVDLMKGAPSHPRTEAAVLREWLAVERERVDRLVGFSPVVGPPPP